MNQDVIDATRARSAAIIQARHRSSSEDSDDGENDNEWTGEWIQLPPLPGRHRRNGGHIRLPRNRQLPGGTDDDDAKDVLFEPGGGPLYGKKHMTYPISAAASNGGTQYEIWEDENWVPEPRHHAREKLFQLALVQRLGFPDHSRGGGGHDACGPVRRCYPDAVYYDMRLVFECDEEQHADERHRFNQLRPVYQFARDREVNSKYAALGYYVVRVAAYRCVDSGGGSRRLHRLTPLECYLQTVRAVDQVLEARRRNYASGKYAGQVLVSACDSDTERFTDAVMHISEINAQSRAPPAPPPEQLARLRGTILEQELAMRDAEDRLAHQERQREKTGTSMLPQTRAAGSSLSEFFSRTLRIGGEAAPATSSHYEARWRSLLDSYNPEERYNERVARIDQDLARATTIRRTIYSLA